jgi:preprotein translocase subunit Sec61beta
MAKNDSGGLMSSAGIMRYFDAEDSIIKLDPIYVIAIAVVFGAVVFGANLYFNKTW